MERDGVRDLKRRLEAIEADKSQEMVASIGFKPFAAWIRDSPPNPNLMYPTIRRYEGNSNARDHISHVEVTTSLLTTDEAILCKNFVRTLQGKAKTWLNTQPEVSIKSWIDL